MNIHYLDATIRAVCTISGVSSNRVIDFKPEATLPQKNEAQAIANAWDFSAPDPTEVADEADKAAAKADNVIQYLVTHTPAECAAYVNANVNNLADAKAFLGKVAMALSVLARREFR